MNKIALPYQVGNFRVTPVIWARLRAEADRLGLPITATARALLGEALADRVERTERKEPEREPA